MRRAAVAAVLAVPLLAAPAHADPVVEGSACAGTTGVSVVVETEDRIEVRCATDFGSGLEALASSGFEVAAPGGFVTAIGGIAAPTGGYWSYYTAGPDAEAYTFSPVGAGSSEPAPGSVEAWTIDPDYTDEVSVQPRLTPAQVRATVPAPRDITDACGFTPLAMPFTDVPRFREAVNCLYMWGVTQGTSPTTYSPSASVTREQMAAFVANVMEDALAGELPAGENAFVDDEASAFEDDINALAAAGIVQGTGAGTYAPRALVTRAQMTAYLVRAYEYVSGRELEPGRNYFPDDDGLALEQDINTAATAGFAAGNADGTFAPRASVRRDHMALFLSRWLDLAVEEGLATWE